MSTLVRWESGKYRPSVPLLHKILEIARKTEGAKVVVDSLETHLVMSPSALAVDSLGALRDYLITIAGACSDALDNSEPMPAESRSKVERAMFLAQEAESLIDAIYSEVYGTNEESV